MKHSASPETISEEANSCEYNLCSALVHAKAQCIQQVKRRLEKSPGVEVHAVTDDNRLLVTVEGSKRREVADQIVGFYNIDGVLSASMIYQYSDEQDPQQTVEVIDQKSAQQINECENVETGKERMSV